MKLSQLVKELFKLLGYKISKKYFWTYNLFYGFPSNLNFDNLKNYNDYVIVIQGPFNNSFSLETIKFYKKIFPNIEIVISTWSISELTQNEIQKLNAHLLQNELPENPGFSNINLQIVTTSNGIKYAKKFNRKYILKTRSDQRIYNLKSLDYLTNLLNIFSGKKNKRLIGCSLDNNINRAFFISDHLMFGEYIDMLNYWSPDLDKRTSIKTEKINDKNQHKFRIGGSYFFTNYIEKHLCQNINSNFEKILAQNFTIINKSDLNLFWNKYNLKENKYYDNFSNNERTFMDWFSLYLKYNDQ